MIRLDTPIGTLSIAASETGIVRVTLGVVAADFGPSLDGSASARRWLDLARAEFDAYFAGSLRTFTTPVDLRRVQGQHLRILDRLAQVGFGETTTYGALAAELDLADMGASEVGGAMASNPVMIIVACHRVVGADGSLVGYAGGLPAKRWLLDLEARDRTPQLDLGWTGGPLSAKPPR